ncbi:S-layer homology domain-containing protein [Paenibacillus rigui]|uniref:S-layer homology domain-containing protein n=1 Tax=Paenibacillus rigui TaxID=554312 RepID=UPI0015C5D68E|nr:S-layer homology domain-containing protein [Paenibacillus rigui]
MKRIVKPLAAALLLSQLPFSILPAGASVAAASSVTSSTYGTPQYTRLSVGVSKIDISLRTRFTTGIYAMGGFGVADNVTSQCTYWVEDTAVATVNSEGAVFSVAEGSTVLHIQFQNLTATVPITVTAEEEQNPITPPLYTEPAVPQSTLDVYSGVDMSRLAAHRKASLDLLNTLRTAVGAAPLTFDDSLNKAAQAHANYQDADKRMGHDETSGKLWFSGAGPGDRARAFGYASSGVGETVAPTSASSSGATQMLIDAPFHRFILLMPSFRDVGVGVSNGYTVIDPGKKSIIYDSKDNGLVYYPYNGQTGIPAYWMAYETPNPLSSYGKAGAKVGYPITISTSTGNKLSFRSAQITDPSGNNVDYYLVDSNKGGNSYGLIFIPKEPLKNNTTYKVNASVTLSSDFESGSSTNKTYDWSFTTQSDTISTLYANSFRSSVPVGSSIKVPSIMARTSSGSESDVTSSVQFTTDSSKVKISDGMIYGISEGKARITATYGGAAYSFDFSVTPNQGGAVPGIVEQLGQEQGQGTGAAAAKAMNFTDISSHWAQATIQWAQQYSIIDGYADGTFRPDGEVTEAEFLAMLFRMYPGSTEALDSAGVSASGDWSDKYYGYAAALNLGLQDSTANRELRSQALKRAQVAQLIAGVSGHNYASDDDAIRFLLDAGYSQGKTASTVAGYAGGERLTRSEALQFLRNLQERGLQKLEKRPN